MSRTGRRQLLVPRRTAVCSYVRNRVWAFLQIAPPWFAVPPSGYGGIEWMVASLADGLVDAGHDVTLHAAGGSVTKATLQTVFDVAPSRHIGNPWYEADRPPVVNTLHGSWTGANEQLYRAISDRIALVGIRRRHRALLTTW